MTGFIVVAPEIYHFVDQKMYFRDCKTLSVFERKIPLTLEFRLHHNAWNLLGTS
jgi:hypothetical protein